MIRPMWKIATNFGVIGLSLCLLAGQAFAQQKSGRKEAVHLTKHARWSIVTPHQREHAHQYFQNSSRAAERKSAARGPGRHRHALLQRRVQGTHFFGKKSYEGRHKPHEGRHVRNVRRFSKKPSRHTRYRILARHHHRVLAPRHPVRKPTQKALRHY
jgi:hypothetical protein